MKRTGKENTKKILNYDTVQFSKINTSFMLYKYNLFSNLNVFIFLLQEINIHNMFSRFCSYTKIHKNSHHSKFILRNMTLYSNWKFIHRTMLTIWLGTSYVRIVDHGTTHDDRSEIKIMH